MQLLFDRAAQTPAPFVATYENPIELKFLVYFIFKKIFTGDRMIDSDFVNLFGSHRPLNELPENLSILVTLYAYDLEPIDNTKLTELLKLLNYALLESLTNLLVQTYYWNEAKKYSLPYEPEANFLIQLLIPPTIDRELLKTELIALLRIIRESHPYDSRWQVCLLQINQLEATNAGFGTQLTELIQMVNQEQRPAKRARFSRE